MGKRHSGLSHKRRTAKPPKKTKKRLAKKHEMLAERKANRKPKPKKKK